MLAHENSTCGLPQADGARERWHTNWKYPPYSGLTHIIGIDWAYVATLVIGTLGSPKYNCTHMKRHTDGVEAVQVFAINDA